MAILAYAMELANDPATETVLNELMKQAVRQGTWKYIFLQNYLLGEKMLQ